MRRQRCPVGASEAISGMQFLVWRYKTGFGVRKNEQPGSRNLKLFARTMIRLVLLMTNRFFDLSGSLAS